MTDGPGGGGHSPRLHNLWRGGVGTPMRRPKRKVNTFHIRAPKKKQMMLDGSGWPNGRKKKSVQFPLPAGSETSRNAVGTSEGGGLRRRVRRGG